MFAVGTVLAGRYRVDRVLGQGGMGMVVAATHLQLNQRVAMKFVLGQFAGNAQIVERFVREARNLAQLRGEHVCRVSDVGTLENGAPYIVMELLEGRDLANVIERDGRVSVVQCVDWVLQACLGIAEAHAARIVHRDLKPANLFVTARPDGTPLVKVLDFGIAKAGDSQSFNLTQTATVMGSPGYMSPEQLRSAKHVDARSDIWALGIILYELVSGRTPFVAETITELTLRVAMDPVPPLGVAVPAGFEAIIQRCLEKDPAARFANVGAFALALAPFGGSNAQATALGVQRIIHPDQAERVEPNSGGPPRHALATTLGDASGAVTPTASPRAHRGRLIVAAAAVAVAALVGIVVVAGMRRDVKSEVQPAAESDPSANTTATAPATPTPTTQLATQPPAAPTPEAPAPAPASAPADAGVAVDALLPPPIDAGQRTRPDAGRPKRSRIPTHAGSADEDFNDKRF